eukprot:32310-Pelagomonas_calceolata.AAC.1
MPNSGELSGHGQSVRRGSRAQKLSFEEEAGLCHVFHFAWLCEKRYGGSNEVNCCDLKLTASSPYNVYLWVHGVDFKEDIVAEFCRLVQGQQQDALKKSGPCFFSVFWLPAWLPGNTHEFFTERVGLSSEVIVFIEMGTGRAGPIFIQVLKAECMHGGEARMRAVPTRHGLGASPAAECRLTFLPKDIPRFPTSKSFSPVEHGLRIVRGVRCEAQVISMKYV